METIIQKYYDELFINWNNINFKIRIKNNLSINGNDLCQIGNKQFNEWLILDSSKELIKDLNLNNNLINESDNTIWVSFDLALIIAQWISPKVMIELNKSFTNHIKNIQDTLIKFKEIENKKSFLKKQHRKSYPNDCIYILSTNDNIDKRIYIIGKTKCLKNRLTTYNKSAEHNVIYHKSCENITSLNIIERMVLYKLDQFREKPNRDRFILPINKKIDFFINIIDECINFFDNKKQHFTNNLLLYKNNLIEINPISKTIIPDFDIQQLKEIFSLEFEGVLNFIKLLHFNPLLPSNHNIYSHDSNNIDILVYINKNNLLHLNKKKFYIKLLKHSINILQKLFEHKKDLFDEVNQIKIKNNLDELKIKSNINLKDFLLKLNLIIHYNSKMVLNTIINSTMAKTWLI